MTKDGAINNEAGGGVLWGILWICLAVFFFVTMDSLSKYIAQRLPMFEVLWGRFFFHALWLALFMRGRVFSGLNSKVPRLQILRALLMVATTGCMFTGLHFLDITDAAALMLTGPLFMTIFAWPMLGERFGWRRASSLCVGFLGALLITRPSFLFGGNAGSWPMLFPLLAAIGYALYSIYTRKVRGIDPLATSLLYTAIGGAVILSVFLPLVFVQPLWWEWLGLVVVGGLGALGHNCLIRAFESAPVTTLAPFNYTNMLWASLYGWLLFGTLPTLWTLVGAMLIACAVLYSLHREQARSEPESIR